MKNLWWGYEHENGALQVKRFFDMEDVKEAKLSGFTTQVVGPFEAENREEAFSILQQKLGSV